jgi:hypothetical protein
MKAAISSLVLFAVACGGSSSSNPDATGGVDAQGGADSGGGDAGPDGPASTPRTIFVIPMENESASAIYGDTADAPYINNTLMPMSAYATMFTDELPGAIPSEPHYVWMEAGTNTFSDTTFTTDNNASSSNSTSSTAHLVTQLAAASVSWVTYQEGMTAGTCPIASISGTHYAAKHDPFVFFQDVSGNPPSSSNADCIAHHKPYSDLATDLASGSMPAYVFITPNLCNDMHGASGCPGNGSTGADIHNGDTWLSNELPAILAYANAHDSVIYLTWDEGSNNQTIPFLVFGPHVKIGTSATAYTHSSMLKSIEEQLGVPVLSTVTSANDFADMFQPGAFP